MTYITSLHCSKKESKDRSRGRRTSISLCTSVCFVYYWRSDRRTSGDGGRQRKLHWGQLRGSGQEVAYFASHFSHFFRLLSTVFISALFRTYKQGDLLLSPAKCLVVGIQCDQKDFLVDRFQTAFQCVRSYFPWKKVSMFHAWLHRRWFIFPNFPKME